MYGTQSHTYSHMHMVHVCTRVYDTRIHTCIRYTVHTDSHMHRLDRRHGLLLLVQKHMCARTHMCTHIHTCSQNTRPASLLTAAHSYKSTCVQTPTQSRVHTCIHRTQARRRFTAAHLTKAHKCTSTRTHSPTHTHTCTYTHINEPKHTHIHTDIHTHTHTHTPTHTHTHTHTQLHSQARPAPWLAAAGVSPRHPPPPPLPH